MDQTIYNYVSVLSLAVLREISVFLKTAKILAIETSDAKVKLEWLYFVMRKNTVFNLKSFKYFNS